MTRRGWKHGAQVPRGFAATTPARAAQCSAARVRVVQVGDRLWAPAWAALAPDGTTNSMLRRAKHDDALRAALIAAARINPLRVPL